MISKYKITDMGSLKHKVYAALSCISSTFTSS
jgi:hypothetical protein